MNKLNFGCGYDIREGWVNVDRTFHGNHQRADILTNWPFLPEKFDLILANHVLHMFGYKELPVVLQTLKNDLTAGGKLHIVDFDPIKAFEAYQRGDAKALIIPDNVEKTLDGKFSAYLTYYSTRKSIFTAKGMIEVLKKAGFSRAISKPVPEDYGRINESWFVEASK